MATYTIGSKSRAHERDVLACPRLRWLGIHSSDIERYQVSFVFTIATTYLEYYQFSNIQRSIHLY